MKIFKHFIVAILLLLICTSSRGQNQLEENFLIWELYSPKDGSVRLTLAAKYRENNKITYRPYRNVTDSSIGLPSNELLLIKDYTENKDSLYFAIKNNQLIDYSHIDTLDLNKLGHWEGINFIVEYPIKISCSVIDNIIFPNNSNLGSVNTPHKVIFTKKVWISHCTFNLPCENAIFKDTVAIYSPITKFHSLWNYYFVKTTFEKPLILYLYFNVSLKPYMQHFKDVIRTDFQEVEFSRCNFDEFDFNTWNCYTITRFEGCTFGGNTLVSKVDSSNTIIFRNSIFNGKISINSFDDNLKIKHSVIKDTLDLYYLNRIENAQIGFSQAILSNKSTVILNPENFNLKLLNFNLWSLKNSTFPFTYKLKDRDFVITQLTSEPQNNEIGIHEENIKDIDETLFFKSQDFYLILEDYVRTLSPNASDADYIIRKFKHEAILYERQYHKNEFIQKAKIIHGIKFLYLTILEYCVGNGFNGENNFFIISLFIIFGFAIIYMYLFRLEVITYIDEKEYIHLYRKGKIQQYYLQEFIKSLWFSSVVFLIPRLPKKYFKFSTTLFYVVLTEWVLGVLLILLFLTYIAIHYPFIKAILGL